MEMEVREADLKGPQIDFELQFRPLGRKLTREERRYNAAVQNCVYAFIQCDVDRNPIEILYVGKANSLESRMLSHRRRRSPTSGRLREALETGAYIEVYYRDDQPSRITHTTRRTRVLDREEEEFQIPSFHIEEIAFIRYLKPTWNSFTFN
jgi:hypothetical protein